MTVSHYTFLPWYRRGIGGLIADAPAAGQRRASVRVELRVEADAASGTAPLSVQRDVELYGPGEIAGIDKRAIIRTDPPDWITNVEPNYLAHIEFYDEDFPWRYSPVGPQQSDLRLTPWLALAVLEEGEFEDVKPLEGKPLAAITVNSFDSFPPFDELWAWAHVHANESLTAGDLERVAQPATSLPKLDALLARNPDLAYSRIVSPRKLKPNTAYHAFLVPSFESGRRAGLGLDQSTLASAGVGAWSDPNRPQAQLMPVYHRWYFRTGDSGDFEELVRLLQPRVVDPKVGYRDMDVQKPGLTLPPITFTDSKGILKLGGALRAPESALWSPDPALTAAQIAERKRYDEWYKPYPHVFQRALAQLINLADDYQTDDAETANSAVQALASVSEDAVTDEEQSPDPVVVPPLYGRWHAAVDRLLTEQDGTPVANPENWLHQLNLDPRYRVAAAAGTQVIQKDQEDLMTAAWAQVGDVIAANRKLRWSRFALEVSTSWHTQRFVEAAGSADRLLRLTRPVHRRVLDDGKTVRAALDKSPMTASVVSAVTSRMLKPRGRLANALGGKGKRLNTARMIDRLNRGEVHTAPPKRAPPGLLSLDFIGSKGVEQAIGRGGIKPQQADAARALGAMLLGGKAGTKAFDKLERPDKFAVINLEGKEPERGTATPQEGERFWGAQRGWIDLMQASEKAAARPGPEKLNVPAITTALVDQLLPAKTIRRRTLMGLAIPNRLTFELEEQFDEIMHHPVIDTPMYKPLEKLSKEFLMPNLSLIPQNSITAVVTNQAFIEAYMVGLNHEFARELLWREYPTDQRGSVFRQFWDVKGLQPEPGENVDVFRERVRDIPKIHRWPRASKLGTHDNRERPPKPQEEDIVLVIRGELLKKYPNTVIYAQKADWGLTNGQPDPKLERTLRNVPNPQTAGDDLIRFPLFEAKVDPDIYFFGFDLNETEAIGRQEGPLTTDNAGWFFVLQERPGEPRFGFDTESAPQAKQQTVNDIGWPDIIPATSTRQFIDPGTVLPPLQALEPDDAEKTDQRADDVIVMNPNISPNSAARWAYVLYQSPVMVAIHAAEMLRRT